LFFLVACEDERLHLHALARLCMMVQKTELLAGLRAAADASSMHDVLVASEQAVLEGLARH
jgi:mannitol/fructose-specific phosphotransferase system IIA component (Ntr-type)